jgi:glycosyltransferase involved in cell wall biosynthesis
VDRFEVEYRMTKPVLSVVIPTCDRRMLLRRAIEYFERRKPFVEAELIIVDAGKSPLPADYIRGHRYVRAPVGDIPVGPRLNLGISLAQAEIVLRQDDDDWYAPDWYDAVLRSVLGSSSGMAGVSDFYALNPFINRAWRWESWGDDPKASHWSGGSMAFRRAIWERTPFNNDKVGSDREFLLDAYKHDPTPRAMVPEGTKKYVHIRHGRNLTGKYIPSAPNLEYLAAVKEIMGGDFAWYEDFSELIGGPPPPSGIYVRGKKPLGYFMVTQ